MRRNGDKPVGGRRVNANKRPAAKGENEMRGDNLQCHKCVFFDDNYDPTTATCGPAVCCAVDDVDGSESAQVLFSEILFTLADMQKCPMFKNKYEPPAVRRSILDLKR